MEYLPLGNLEDQNEIRRFLVREVLVILIQTLLALEYLHKRSIVHRDLKPPNILLKSRKPLDIKVADFGLAKEEGKQLETLCGTESYKAPEIAQYLKGDRAEEKYNEAVDIWSLGVIILRFLRGLPYPGRGEGIGWCQKIIAMANEYDFEDPIHFLKENMLVWEAEERSSAETCIREARKISIPSESIDVTPTSSAVEGASHNEDPTVTFYTAEPRRMADPPISRDTGTDTAAGILAISTVDASCSEETAIFPTTEYLKCADPPFSQGNDTLPPVRRSKRLGGARKTDPAEADIADISRYRSGSFRPEGSLTRQAWDESSHRERIGWRAGSTPSGDYPCVRDLQSKRSKPSS
jgi:serine/threonine protein kinase